MYYDIFYVNLSIKRYDGFINDPFYWVKGSSMFSVVFNDRVSATDPGEKQHDVA